jgi:hypothetical protein
VSDSIAPGRFLFFNARIQKGDHDFRGLVADADDGDDIAVDVLPLAQKGHCLPAGRIGRGEEVDDVQAVRLKALNGIALHPMLSIESRRAVTDGERWDLRSGGLRRRAVLPGEAGRGAHGKDGDARKREELLTHVSAPCRFGRGGR